MGKWTFTILLILVVLAFIGTASHACGIPTWTKEKGEILEFDSDVNVEINGQEFVQVDGVVTLTVNFKVRDERYTIYSLYKSGKTVRAYLQVIARKG